METIWELVTQEETSSSLIDAVGDTINAAGAVAWLWTLQTPQTFTEASRQKARYTSPENSLRALIFPVLWEGHWWLFVADILSRVLYELDNAASRLAQQAPLLLA